MTPQETAHLPKINLSERQIFDLELILNGGFEPLKGFMVESDYRSVVENMRLSDGSLWPIPIVLDVENEKDLTIGQTVVLADSFGTPLATIEIQSKFTLDKEMESERVYGTNDVAHYGVDYLFNETHDQCIGGPVQAVNAIIRNDFASLRYTPEELKNEFKKRGWDKVVAFQTRNPIHKAHFALISNAHKKIEAPVLIHPVVGLTRTGDIDYVTRVKTYQAIAEKYGKDFTFLALLPLAMRMAGPREALWHMIIRKNHGVTHFIVGRDHAGPGKDSNGVPFYDPSEAVRLTEEFAKEVGIEVVSSPEIVYSSDRSEYVVVTDLQPDEKTESISGTEFRNMMANNDSVPDWFSFPETISALSDMQSARKKGSVVFLTGLSGAGKTTVANALVAKLTEHNILSTLLDGDVVRKYLTSELGFSKEHRDLNVLRVGYVASEIAKHGGVAVCSLIAPYKETRNSVKKMISAHSDFCEVYVSTPIAECEKRDVKGLYKKAREGTLKNFTGVSDPYEEPKDADVVIDTSQLSVDEAVAKIINKIL